MAASTARSILLLLGMLGSSCSAYEAGEHELSLRVLPEADALLVLEVERGLGSGESEDALAKATEALRELSAGRRRYPPEGGLLHIDFDKVPESEDLAEHEKAFADDLRELAGHVSVEEARLFTDPQALLGLFRLTRVTNLRRVLGILDRSINHEIIQQAEKSFEPEFPIFDGPTRELCVARAQEGGSWLAVEGTSLLIDLPMTKENAARCRNEFDNHKAREEAGWMKGLFERSRLEDTASGLRLRVVAGPEPLTLIEDATDVRASPGLLAHLRASGFSILGVESLSAAQSKVREAR